MENISISIPRWKPSFRNAQEKWKRLMLFHVRLATFRHFFHTLMETQVRSFPLERWISLSDGKPADHRHCQKCPHIILDGNDNDACWQPKSPPKQWCRTEARKLMRWMKQNRDRNYFSPSSLQKSQVAWLCPYPLHKRLSLFKALSLLYSSPLSLLSNCQWKCSHFGSSSYTSDGDGKRWSDGDGESDGWEGHSFLSDVVKASNRDSWEQEVVVVVVVVYKE